MIDHSSKFGEGVFPDVAIYRGQVYVAYQAGNILNVRTTDGTVDWLLRLEPGTLAFPRLGIVKDKLFIVWRNGGNDFAKAHYAEVGNLASIVDLDVSPGNDPVAIGSGRIAYQALDPQRVMTVIPEEVSVTRSRDGIRPTGLSRIMPNGLVTFVDEDRLSVNGITRPSWAGLLVAGEGPTGGAVIPSMGVSFWKPLDCFTPRLAAAGDAYALATWGNTIRVVTFHISELNDGTQYFATAPPVDVPPPFFDPPKVPPVNNQIDIVRAVRAKYPRTNPGGAPLGDDAGNAIVEVAKRIGAKVFRKDGGDHAFVAQLGMFVSRTIIGQGTLGNQWVKVFSDGEGAAGPIWNVGDTPADGEYLDVSNVQLPGDVPPPVVVPPVVTPPADPTLANIVQRLTALETWRRS